MKSPLFSIIIATYNREQFIAKAIKSVLEQTYQEWELIIIDDGSTDNSRKIIKSFNDERIKYFYQENQERSVARNNGIEKSKGDYICFLDSDDYYLPNHLELFKSTLINNPEVTEKDILVTNRLYEANNIRREFHHYIPPTNNLNDILIYNAIIYSPPIQCICIHNSFKDFIVFKNDWLPYYECNHFSYELIQFGYKYKFLNELSVIMVSHDKNTTSGSLDFHKFKLKAINHFSRKEKLKHHHVIKKNKMKLLLIISNYQKYFIMKVLYLTYTIISFPTIIVKKEHLSFIKAILFKHSK